MASMTNEELLAAILTANEELRKEVELEITRAINGLRKEMKTEFNRLDTRIDSVMTVMIEGFSIQGRRLKRIEKQFEERLS